MEDVRGRATLLRLPIILFTFPSTSSSAFSAPPPSLRVAIIFPVAMFIFILIIIFAALLFVTLLALIPPLSSQYPHLPPIHVLSGPVDARIRHPFHPTSCTLRIPARLPLHAFTPLSVIPPCPILNTVSSLISASSFLLALSALLFTVLMIFGRKSW